MIMSAQPALIAALLALGSGSFQLLEFVLVLLGSVVAYTLFRAEEEVFSDVDGYVLPDYRDRRSTIPAPASGALESRVLLTTVAILCLIGGCLALYFLMGGRSTAVGLTAGGICFLLLYDAVAIPMKRMGLAEVAAMLIWGPLVIGGGNAMITGHVSTSAFLVAIPYGLGAMSIVIGRHSDQIEFDADKGLRTLPALIGEKVTRFLNVGTILLMYLLTIGLTLTGLLTRFAAIVILALPSALDAIAILGQPRPDPAKQKDARWPVRYHDVCLRHSRTFGWLYIAGLASSLLRRL